jgi:hypothetical protein
MTTRTGTGAAVVGALSLFLLAGCGVTLPGTTTGSGTVKTETRTVSGFTAVELGGNGDVTVQQNGTESLTISAEENLLPLLTSEVVDGTLKLGIKDNAQLNSTQPITYQVTVKNLSGLTLGGSGNQTATGVKTASLVVRVAGSGSVTTSGTADAQEIQMAGSGTYRGSGLASKTASINSAGSGTVELAVSDKLDVKIVGSGSVTYSGSPQVTQSIRGSGTLRKQ